MVDGSTGSFATLFQDEGSSQSHVHHGTQQQEAPLPARIETEESYQEQLERELREARWQASEAFEAHRQLLEGVRIVARQMKHSHIEYPEDSCDDPFDVPRDRTWSENSSVYSFMSEDDKRLDDLSRGLVGADLMGLSHAAQMLGENAWRASQEASVLVHDIQGVQLTCQDALDRAHQAEKTVNTLFEKNKSLRLQVEKYKAERKVLVRQVKALLEENAELQQEQAHLKQEEMVRAVELHIAGALQLHEKQLTMVDSKRKGTPRRTSPSPTSHLFSVITPSKDEEDEQPDYVKVPDVLEEQSSPTDSLEAEEQHPPPEISSRIASEIAMESDAASPEQKETVIVSESSAAELQPKPRGVGFGATGAIGFGALSMKPSWMVSRPLMQQKSIPPKPLEDAKNVVEPVLVTPTNANRAVDSPSPFTSASPVEESNTANINSGCDKEISVCIPRATRISSYLPVKFSGTRCHTPVMSAQVSPSPIESTGPSPQATSRMIGFFQRATPSNGHGRKSLIQLDEEPPLEGVASKFEGANESRSPSDSATQCEWSTERSSSSLPYDAAHKMATPRPTMLPKAVTIDRFWGLSPLAHSTPDIGSEAPLSDNVLRSLAVPRMIQTDLECSWADISTPTSQCVKNPLPEPSDVSSCPPEISKIYEEINALYEC